MPPASVSDSLERSLFFFFLEYKSINEDGDQRGAKGENRVPLKFKVKASTKYFEPTLTKVVMERFTNPGDSSSLAAQGDT